MVVARDCRFADHGTAALAIYGGYATLEHCEILRSPPRMSTSTSIAAVAAKAAAADADANTSAGASADSSAGEARRDVAVASDQVGMDVDGEDNKEHASATPTNSVANSEAPTTAALSGAASSDSLMDTSAEGGSGGETVASEVADGTTTAAPAPVPTVAASGTSTITAPSLKVPLSAHQEKLQALQAKAEKDLAKLLNTLPVSASARVRVGLAGSVHFFRASEKHVLQVCASFLWPLFFYVFVFIIILGAL